MFTNILVMGSKIIIPRTQHFCQRVQSQRKSSNWILLSQTNSSQNLKGKGMSDANKHRKIQPLELVYLSQFSIFNSKKCVYMFCKARNFDNQCNVFSMTITISGFSNSIGEPKYFTLETKCTFFHSTSCHSVRVDCQLHNFDAVTFLDGHFFY